MRRENLFLTDIVEAAGAIRGFIAEIDKATFADDDLVRSAVLYKLTVIGEAAARVPPEIRSSYPEIPWSDIVAFRNIVVHAYFAIDWAIVWTAATEDVPMLKSQIDLIVQSAPDDETENR